MFLAACSESPKGGQTKHQNIDLDSRQMHSTVQSHNSKKNSGNFEYIFLGFDEDERAFFKDNFPEILSEKSYSSKERKISLVGIHDQNCKTYWGQYDNDRVNEHVMYLGIYEAPQGNNSDNRRFLISKNEALYCPRISDEGYEFKTLNIITNNTGRLMLSPTFKVNLREAPDQCKPDSPAKGVVLSNGTKYKIDWPKAFSQYSEKFQSATFLKCQTNGYARVFITNETQQNLALLNWSRNDVEWPDKKISEMLNNCDGLKFCEDEGGHISLGPSVDIFNPITFGVYRTNTRYGVKNFAYIRGENSKTASFVTRSLDGLVITAAISIADWTVQADAYTEIDELFAELFANIDIEK